MKILNLYTAEDDESISAAFMKKIKNHLGENRKEGNLIHVTDDFDLSNTHVFSLKSAPNAPLLMESKRSFPLTIPFNPTDVDLRRISLPSLLLKKGLGTVLTKI